MRSALILGSLTALTVNVQGEGRFLSWGGDDDYEEQRIMEELAEFDALIEEEKLKKELDDFNALNEEEEQLKKELAEFEALNGE